MSRNYQITRPKGQQGHPNLLTPCPNIQMPDTFNVLKDGSKFHDHNIAGQVYSKLVIEDKNGNRMTFHQKQQVLNLVNGCKNRFFVSDKDGCTPNRRKRYVRRQN